MLFHENCLLADNSNDISYLIFFPKKLAKLSQKLSSAAVVIGVLRGNKMSWSGCHRDCSISFYFLDYFNVSTVVLITY